MISLTLSQVAIAICALYVFGVATLSALALWPRHRQQAIEFIKTFGTATVLIAAITALFLLGPKAMIVVLPAAITRIAYEVAAIRLGTKRAAQGVALGTGVCTLALMLWPALVPAVLGLWCLALARLILIPWPSESLAKAVIDICVYPLLPAMLLAAGTQPPQLAALLLAAYLMVEIFDSFALLFGALWGRVKAFPTLSPNKTIEGLLGGGFALLTLSLITGVALGLPLLQVGIGALAVGALAVVGDLAASRHKRIAGVKDYPKVLPRQGGLLDSLDSWIAACGGLVAIDILVRLW